MAARPGLMPGLFEVSSIDGRAIFSPGPETWFGRFPVLDCGSLVGM